MFLPTHSQIVPDGHDQGSRLSSSEPSAVEDLPSNNLFSDVRFPLSVIPAWPQMPGIPNEGKKIAGDSPEICTTKLASRRLDECHASISHSSRYCAHCLFHHCRHVRRKLTCTQDIAPPWLDQLGDFGDDGSDESMQSSINNTTHQQLQPPITFRTSTDTTLFDTSNDQHTINPIATPTTRKDSIPRVMSEQLSPMTTGEQQEQASREAIFNEIIAKVQQAGFSNFDSAVLAYYTEQFEKGTPIHNTQKMSRSRGLPSVLKTLRDSANNWSQWEARGYKDEVIRSAETIFKGELDQASQCFNSHCDSACASTKAFAAPLECAGDDELEDSLPNLWALIFALTSADSPSIQRARCQTLIKVITTLAIR